MIVIGHRGAAGLALENSLAGLQAALRYDIDAIEFDVRITADGEMVLMHDNNTGRVADKTLIVRRSTLAELKKLKLVNGQTIPTLDEALQILKTAKMAMIEIKDRGTAEQVINIVRKHPQVNAGFCSMHHQELKQLRQAFPDAPIYASEHFSPLEIIQKARKIRATGISLNKWLVNPLTYRLAKRYGLHLAIYTVNNRFLQKFFRQFYPGAAFFTDHPERFANKRKQHAAR